MSRDNINHGDVKHRHQLTGQQAENEGFERGRGQRLKTSKLDFLHMFTTVVIGAESDRSHGRFLTLHVSI